MEFTTCVQAAFPSNPTLESDRQELSAMRPYGANTLYGLRDSNQLHFESHVRRPRSLPYAAPLTATYPIGVGMGCSLRAELFPFQSPLLRESRLVSFPPLSDMLKFRGYSPLKRGRHRYTRGITAPFNR